MIEPLAKMACKKLLGLKAAVWHIYSKKLYCCWIEINLLSCEKESMAYCSHSDWNSVWIRWFRTWKGEEGPSLCTMYLSLGCAKLKTTSLNRSDIRSTQQFDLGPIWGKRGVSKVQYEGQTWRGRMWRLKLERHSSGQTWRSKSRRTWRSIVQVRCKSN